MGRTADGRVEGFCDSEHRFRIDVQFHPERHSADDPECVNIFQAFAVAARAFSREGRPGGTACGPDYHGSMNRGIETLCGPRAPGNRRLRRENQHCR